MTFFHAHLTRCPVIAILRGLTPAAAGIAAERLWSSGVELVEITVQDDVGFEALAKVGAIAADTGQLVGAGSVTSIDAFDRTITCGASFVVSPGLDLKLVDHASQLEVPYLPGVATPSEIQVARSRGVLDLKLFPARELGGSSFVKAMSGPFPDVQLVPSGGVSVADIDTYLAASALGVGIGGELTTPTGAQNLDEWLALREIATG